MGEFLVRQVDIASGVEISRFARPNFLAYEGLSYLYHQVFPPFGASLGLVMGVSDPCGVYPSSRPNRYGAEASFGPALTLAQCSGEAGNEGGCYTSAMRSSFGYARRSLSCVASMVSDGGMAKSTECTFPNNHSWLPQIGSDWNLPWTVGEIEQPPPEWSPWEAYEPVVGYPWQKPRKRCLTECDPYDPSTCQRSYMYQYDPTGGLDWLCDFRKMGGFPISMAFLASSTVNKLVAAAAFRALVLLRPGTALHIKYEARVSSVQVTRDFALRFMKCVFVSSSENRYDSIYCRPLLSGVTQQSRRTTYNDVESYFHFAFQPVALDAWTYVTGTPPYVMSSIVPQWENETENTIGPFVGLAVYGSKGRLNELMWVTKIDPPLSVPVGDFLRVPGKVRFQLDGN